MFRIQEIEVAFAKVMQYLGLVGSALMYAIYSRRNLASLSMSIYIRFMAVICFCSNVVTLIMIDYYFQIFRLSWYLGKLLDFTPKLLVPFSVWLEVLANVDRFLTILFPFRFKCIQNKKIQFVYIVNVLILNTLLHLDKLILTRRYIHVIFGIPENKDGRAKISKLIGITQLVSNTLLPFVIMLTTSIVMVAGVWRVHRRMKSSFTSTRDASLHRKLVRDIKFGTTMIVLNVSFFISIGLNQLSNVVNLNPFSSLTQPFCYFFFYYLLAQCSNYYYFLIFYIQLLVNSVVKSELIKIFHFVFKFLRSILPHRNSNIS